MDLEQARNLLKLTPQEIKSVERYLNSAHPRVNGVCNMDAIHYNINNYDRLCIPGDKDKFEQSLQDFVNIYSVMVKLHNQSGTIRLYRDSLDDETQVVPENSFMLASTDFALVADLTTKYGNPALSTYIIPKDVPVLDVKQFKTTYGKGSSIRDENEFVISPFVNSSKQFNGKNRDRCSLYNITLERQTIEDVEPEELERLKQEVTDGFDAFMESLKEEINLDDQARFFFYSKNEGAFEKYKDFSDRKMDKRKQNDQYRNSVLKLVKGLCRVKELEISNAHKVITEHEFKLAAELEAEKLQQAAEAEKKRSNSDLHQKYDRAIQMVQTATDDIRNEKNSLFSIAVKEKQSSEALGVQYNDDLYKAQILQRVTQVLSQLERIREHLISRNDFTDKNIEDVTSEMTKFDEQLVLLEEVHARTDVLPQLSSQYARESVNNVKENLHNKAFRVLKSARLENYFNQLRVLQAQRVTIFDRITGKAKLREEQMRQLELKIQYENSTKPEKQARYSVHDILGDIYYTADVELGGNPTPEIQDLITRINAQYQENYRTPTGQIKSRPFSRSNLVAAKVAQKAQTGESAMTVQPNRLRGFFAARRATKEIREQNNRLAQKINQLRQQNFADAQHGNNGNKHRESRG